MKNTLISIITVVKNQQIDLDKTAESLAKQNFFDFEWIIQDASDKKLLIRKKINLPKNNINHFVESDINLYDGMNKAIEKSSGFALIFLNSGDYFYSINALKIIANDLKKLKKSDKNFFLLAYSYFDILSKEIKYSRYIEQCQGFFSYRTPTSHQATVYSKTCFELLKYRIEFSPVSDHIFFMELIKKMKSSKSFNLFFQKSEKIIINYNVPGISSKRGFFQARQFYKSRKYTGKNIFIILVICLSKIYHYPIGYLKRFKKYF